MSEINRMASPVCPASLADATLADPEVLECPYPTYALLREEAPVFKDPNTGIYVVSRYEDQRKIALDYDNFSNFRYSNDHSTLKGNARLAHERFLEKGWVPGASLAARDDPNHKQMRAIFDQAFRPKRIKAIDADVEKLAYQLMAEFIDDGHCNFVHQYAVPLPLFIICQQMGADMNDVWQIKKWTDGWIKGLSIGLSADETLYYTDLEIEAQHYFQAIFDRLRKTPDDSLLSDLVNLEVPGWGRTLTNNELHAEMMQDTFVGGSETTTNALAAGLMLLDKDRSVWQQLSANPEKYLKTFCDEVVRLETPTQGMMRITKNDYELHGVLIPKGAQVDLRYASGNRDPRHFENPEAINLERKNAGSHLGFSTGTHYCLGAPLARRELYWGFKAFIDSVDDFSLVPEKNNLRHLPNYSLRILKELHIEFSART
ncbi:MAG: cytochrome P450 [Pseudomonadales bacterium]|nr:cytochrome P450 [Pseudomonadales bacterium]